MKTIARFLIPVLSVMLSLMFFAGCANQNPDEDRPNALEESYGSPEEEDSNVNYAVPYSNGPGDELPNVEGPTEGPPAE